MCTTGAEYAAPEEQHKGTSNLRRRLQEIAPYAKAGISAYVALQLGVAAIKFLRRRLGGKRGQTGQTPESQRSELQRSTPAQQAPPPTGEDSWSVVDAPAPPTPEGYKPIVTAVLPCSPQELYGTLFSSSGTELYLQQHREVGKHWDVVATGWRRTAAAAAAGAGTVSGSGASSSGADGSLLGATSVFEYVVGQPGSGGYTRLLTFWNPKKPPNTADTRCVQRQQLCVYRGGVLLFATAMNMLDIPFRDCFTVNTFWRVEPGPAPGTCALAIDLKVNFVKRAMGVGGIISATTFRETAAFFAAFVANVERYLLALRQQHPQQQQNLHGGGAAGALPPAAAGGLAGGAALHAVVSPFAAAAGPPPLPHPFAAPCASTAGGAGAPLRQTLPVWKQARALLVFLLLSYMFLTQLHQGQQLAALQAALLPASASSPPHSACGGSVSGSSPGVAAAAGQLLAAVVGQVAAGTGSLHGALLGLLERMGAAGREAGPAE